MLKNTEWFQANKCWKAVSNCGAFLPVTPPPPPPSSDVTVRTWTRNVIRHILWECLYGTNAMTWTNVSVPVVCRNLNCQLVNLATGLSLDTCCCVVQHWVSQLLFFCCVAQFFLREKGFSNTCPYWRVRYFSLMSICMSSFALEHFPHFSWPYKASPGLLFNPVLLHGQFLHDEEAYRWIL